MYLYEEDTMMPLERCGLCEPTTVVPDIDNGHVEYCWMHVAYKQEKST